MQSFLARLIFASMFFSSLNVLAQSTDPNDPSSPNYKGKNKIIQQQKKFFGSVGASFGRGFDEFAEAFGSYSFSGNYLFEKSSITLNIDYSHPLDGDTYDRRQWMFEDLEFVWNAPSFKPVEIGGQKISLVPRLSYRGPLSRTSQLSTTFGTVTGNLMAITNLGRFTFILSPRLSLSYHEYETTDVEGNIKNVPIAGTMVGTVRMLLIKNLYLTGTAFYYHGFDYDFGSVPVNGVSGNVYYQINPQFGLMAYAGWRDRVYSNNSVFDDDASSMGVGVVANF